MLQLAPGGGSLEGGQPVYVGEDDDDEDGENRAALVERVVASTSWQVRREVDEVRAWTGGRGGGGGVKREGDKRGRVGEGASWWRP